MRAGAGAVATAVLAMVDTMLVQSQALAIAGVDDAVLGGVVLALLTLAGYAVSAEVSQATLSAMGYSFSDFASDASNQSAAVTRAIADANNLGVEVNRAQAESAAQAIAAGTGAVGDWFADIADSGRIALDGIVNGVGAIPAALWGLIAEYESAVLTAYPTAIKTSTWAGNGDLTLASSSLSFRVLPLADLLQVAGAHIGNLPFQPTWAIYGVLVTQSYTNYTLWIGRGTLPYFNGINFGGSNFECQESTFSTFGNSQGSWIRRSGWQTWRQDYGMPLVSSDLVIGPTLPGVERAADAPETYGAGYDKTILGNDLVIGPTGDVVSAGTIALPVDWQHVQLPYVDGLYQQGAGVVSGIQDLPISGQTSAVVGTEEGVVSMPISQAISTQTSLAEVVTPAEPVVPPGTPDVGPWQPAYTMPFYEVWPFNLVYTFVEQLSALGGS